MKSKAEIAEYLEEAERNAITSMAANKWERFGYWAAQSVHLRKILGISHTESPFRDFAELARVKLNRQQGNLLGHLGMSGAKPEHASEPTNGGESND